MSKQESRTGNLRAMPLSPRHPAFLRDQSHFLLRCHPPAAAPPGGLTSTRPSALGCRARLTPIHSSSRSSRQVFPQDIPRVFPGGEREGGKSHGWRNNVLLAALPRVVYSPSVRSQLWRKQSVPSTPSLCMLFNSAATSFLAGLF